MNLRSLATLSGLYDLGLAVTMLFFARAAARAFGAPDPVPLLNAQLNGVFTLSLAAGYFWAREDVRARRGYFWVAGVLAKGLGALLDHGPAQGDLAVPGEGAAPAVSDGENGRSVESGVGHGPFARKGRRPSIEATTGS